MNIEAAPICRPDCECGPRVRAEFAPHLKSPLSQKIGIVSPKLMSYGGVQFGSGTDFRDQTDRDCFGTGKEARFPEQPELGMNRPTFALTLPSDLRMLSVARTFVEAVCQACALERALLHALVLATGEAVTNIVRHAHRDLSQAEMQIHLEVRADGVLLTFIDQGQPFDISTVPQLPPGELRIGGRGVFLLRTLMDEVACHPRGDQPGNALRLFKRVSSPAKSAG